MRFFGTTVVKYALVETDAGSFRVNKTHPGNYEVTSKWDNEVGTWMWCDTDMLSLEDLAAILKQGVDALEMK